MIFHIAPLSYGLKFPLYSSSCASSLHYKNVAHALLVLYISVFMQRIILCIAGMAFRVIGTEAGPSLFLSILFPDLSLTSYFLS